MDKDTTDNENKSNSPSSEMSFSPINQMGKVLHPNPQNQNRQCISEGKDNYENKSVHTTKSKHHSKGNRSLLIILFIASNHEKVKMERPNLFRFSSELVSSEVPR